MWEGSSPLARGLQARARPYPPGYGIIPARAGFTSGPLRTGPAHRDHPRSRGVYTAPSPASGPTNGSSPLARGLLAHTVGDCQGNWIIPARAGFTHEPKAWTRDRRDHPRSRGVYEGLADAPEQLGGSSPLARGLLADPFTGSGSTRIIPARAGFTSRRFASSTSASDHPRSRGVYSPEKSSRGGTNWIIPARAGFTLEEGEVGHILVDHPRSRGVYLRGSTNSTEAAGSSPLARGLPAGHTQDDAAAGIIPARAGFTRGRRRRSGDGWDHPRSRGVYARCQETGRWPGGSSPLARGLRGAPGSSPLWDEDHPRSRGVYFDVTEKDLRRVGSSPLARGLRARPSE